MTVVKFTLGNNFPLNIGGQYHFGRTDVHSNRFEVRNTLGALNDAAPHQLSTSRFGLVLGVGH